MKTISTIEVSRDVTPGWIGGKGGNLGTFTQKTKQPDGKGLAEMMTDPVVADAVADVFGSQLHIKFGGPANADYVESLLPPRKGMVNAKNEQMTAEEYKLATYEDAKRIAAEKLPGHSPDYAALFVTWATEVYAKRGEKKDSRDILADYHAIVGNLEKKWEGQPADKRSKFLANFALAPELVTADTAGIIAAVEAKYRAPKVDVSVGDMFK